MRRVGLGFVAFCGFLVVGCTPAGTDAARQTAVEFQQRVEVADWTGACDLLSGHARQQLESAAAQSCTRVLPRLRLPSDQVGSVEVWGRNASAEVGVMSVFMSRFAGGWRIIAAGCIPRGEDLPFDCSVGG